MILHYIFEDIPCWIIDGTIGGIWPEPRYVRENREVEYDYEVEIDYDEVFEYLKPSNWRQMSKEQQEAYTLGFEKLWFNDLVNTEVLEEDEKFIEFVKEKYEEDAREECEKENEY